MKVDLKILTNSYLSFKLIKFKDSDNFYNKTSI